jgi:hypothetical protein
MEASLSSSSPPPSHLPHKDVPDKGAGSSACCPSSLGRGGAVASAMRPVGVVCRGLVSMPMKRQKRAGGDDDDDGLEESKCSIVPCGLTLPPLPNQSHTGRQAGGEPHDHELAYS